MRARQTQKQSASKKRKFQQQQQSTEVLTEDAARTALKDAQKALRGAVIPAVVQEFAAIRKATKEAIRYIDHVFDHVVVHQCKVGSADSDVLLQIAYTEPGLVDEVNCIRVHNTDGGLGIDRFDDVSSMRRPEWKYTLNYLKFMILEFLELLMPRLEGCGTVSIDYIEKKLNQAVSVSMDE